MAEENSISIRPFTPDAFVELAQNGTRGPAR
jgi:hypothetical protein